MAWREILSLKMATEEIEKMDVDTDKKESSSHANAENVVETASKRKGYQLPWYAIAKIAIPRIL